MAYRYTGRAETAEELTQEIFLKVYLNLSSFSAQMGSLRNWILRVGRNVVIDHYRTTRRDRYVAGSEEIEQLDFQADRQSESPFAELERKEKARLVMLAVGSLAAELKEAVMLRDLEGLTYHEIAQILDIPEGTVKSRINRGRIELAKRIRKSRLQDRSLAG